jgi:hypothetical protein
MDKWLRWTLGVIAPVVGVFAGVMSREWREDILGAFPFVMGEGPIAWRAVAFWGLVCIPVVFAGWTFRIARREEVAGQRRRTEAEAAHAGALTLTVSRTGDIVELWANNRGTHFIRDIELVAIADHEGPVQLPPLVANGVPGVTVWLPLGDWFIARVSQLNPDKGLLIGEARFAVGDFTRIDFDCSWHDHEGKKRKSHAVTDLATVEREIPLVPRPGRSATG